MTRAYSLLSPETEAPGVATLVAIDAEFVALQQEEVEIKADGSRETIRPSRLGLARVSVLRGSGVDEGVPFIDDYIATTTEPIVDHLTAYSGIQPGDLDPALSTHHLVSLKVAYKKLWLLLHLGCIFVGHGLPKDFRIINIYVPRTQVVDTVELYFIRARQRKLSLRFLAWYVLREDIQSDSHDSIEDSRSALRLYRKYQEFQDAGVFVRILADIYARGRELQFKVPTTQGQRQAQGQGQGQSLSSGQAGTAPAGQARGTAASGTGAAPGVSSRRGGLGERTSTSASIGNATTSASVGGSGYTTALPTSPAPSPLRGCLLQEPASAKAEGDREGRDTLLASPTLGTPPTFSR